MGGAPSGCDSRLYPLPVIGVPVDSSPLKGMDALLSIVQMPPGIPVATMAIGKGGARNAAIYSASILGLKYPDIGDRVKKFRERLAKRLKKLQRRLILRPFIKKNKLPIQYVAMHFKV